MKTALKIFMILDLAIVIIVNSVLSQLHTDVIAAVILRTEGTVLFKDSESDSWIPAQEKQPITVEDSLKTEESSSVIFMFTASGSRIYQNENTEIGITALLTLEGRPIIDRIALTKGELYSRIKTGTNFEIKTSHCFIISKGGEFITQCDKEKTTVAAVSKTVEISNESGTVSLERFHKTTVLKDESPSKPLPFSEIELKKMLDWLE